MRPEHPFPPQLAHELPNAQTQGQFRVAGRADIAEDLERYIQLLMNALDATVTLDVRGTD